MDVPVVCPVQPTFVRAAAAERSAAAAAAAPANQLLTFLVSSFGSSSLSAARFRNWGITRVTWRSCCWAPPSSVPRPTGWTAWPQSGAPARDRLLAQPVRHNARALPSALRVNPRNGVQGRGQPALSPAHPRWTFARGCSRRRCRAPPTAHACFRTHLFL